MSFVLAIIGDMVQNNAAGSLPWEEIAGIAKDKFDQVPEETYRFALDESNHEVLVESALKSLQKADPENATREKAEELAEIMKMFAKMALGAKK